MQTGAPAVKQSLLHMIMIYYIDPMQGIYSWKS